MIVSLAGEVLLINLRHSSPYVEYVIRVNGRKTRERADLVVINEHRNIPSFLIELNICGRRQSSMRGQKRKI